MRVAAEHLLEGPQGRRLCLEVLLERLRTLGEATEAEWWRHAAVFYASHELAPNPGTLFGPGGSTVPDGYGSVERAAQGLDLSAMPSLSLGEAEVLGALISTVDRAAYWQEPDGEDVLAARPEVREQLAAVAAEIAASPVAAEWGSDIDREQWSVDYAGGSLLAAPSRAAQLLQEWGVRTRADEQRALTERSSNPKKPWSGTWWSVPPHELLTSTRAWVNADRGPIGLHLAEDSVGPETATVWPVGVLPDARVAVIRSPDDWAELCRAYPLDVTGEKRHDWYRTTGRAVSGKRGSDGDAWVMPDWEAASQDYDGVHLTVLGYLRAAGTAIDVDEGRASVIAGWNPDETYWLTDRVRVWDAPEAWQRIEPNTHTNAEAWVRV